MQHFVRSEGYEHSRWKERQEMEIPGPHPLIEKLEGIGRKAGAAQPVVVIEGFIGTQHGDSFRMYRDFNLSRWIEVARKDVVDCQSVSQDGRVRVLLPASARIVGSQEGLAGEPRECLCRTNRTAQARGNSGDCGFYDQAIAQTYDVLKTLEERGDDSTHGVESRLWRLVAEFERQKHEIGCYGAPWSWWDIIF